MAQHYTEYLAANVLNEQQLISYRSLSRALKVHSNLAKQMLFEFHNKQNSKKPGTVHATYLITGTKRQTKSSQANGTETRDDDDTVMQSSPPFPGSSAPVHDEDEEEVPTVVRSVMLVKEEQLEKAKATFDSIIGIHVYSLQAKGLSDTQALTECNRKIATSYASEDPQEVWKQYGTIQNPNAKRRTTRGVPLQKVASKAVPAPKVIPPTTAKQPSTFGKAAPKPQTSSRPISKASTPEPASKPPAAKKDASALFKSFAKTKPKAKQEESQGSGTTSQDTKDEPMGGFSDDEDEFNDDGVIDEIETKMPAGKSKKERAADLEAMMDQEDEPMEDAPEPVVDDAAENAIDKPEAPPEPQETVTVQNGRRRGRRRVMKKKTVKDEDGYLVTKEEAAWESFSEDEPAPKKLKPTTTNAKSGGGPKKATKIGQGNIMNFFGKK
ncbi:Hypothetical protein R9X50_00754100 [Acrodontium crateriforme]|uniref:DNA polymerase delta subunit 3 n=1 Tax=Acrodontium crateriforme TaxID=150365 RepID=A0AAQ3RE74_9PEZI|nr:Hypothetical protein R9X50_00754100 [Acrodontium crateriforme]